MQRLEVSGAVRPIYGSLGVKRLRNVVSLCSWVIEAQEKFCSLPLVLLFVVISFSYICGLLFLSVFIYFVY